MIGLCGFVLGKGLTALTKLRTLRMDCNKILRLDAAELSCCVHLTSINISYNLVDSLSVGAVLFLLFRELFSFVFQPLTSSQL